VTKAARLTSDALDDVRRSVGTVRTDVARRRCRRRLRALAQEAGLPVTMRVEGVARPLPPGVEHALFRAAPGRSDQHSQARRGLGLRRCT